MLYQKPQREDTAPTMSDGTLMNPYAFATPPPGGTYADVVLADSPVGYWRLNEVAGATAVSEIGGDGTYINDPTLGSASQVDVSPTFDGVNEAVTLPSAPGVLVGDFTIEAWVYLSSTTNPQSILVKSDTGYSANSKPQLWAVDRYPSKLRFGIRLTNGGDYVGNSSTSDLPANLWVRVAICRRGSDLEFWMNDSLDRTVAGFTTADLGNFTDFTQVARWWNGSAGYMNHANGQIDEPAIYAYALSLSEHQAHHAAGVA